MTARGLQRLDAQDCERWRLGCKNQLTPACRNLCWAPEIEGSSFLEQNDDDAHVERKDEERGPVKALLLEADGTKKGRPKKRWKEVLECDMTARGLQRLDAQDRERWKLGCKNQLTPACGNLCWAPEIEGSTFLEQNNDDDDVYMQPRGEETVKRTEVINVNCHLINVWAKSLLLELLAFSFADLFLLLQEMEE